MSATRENLNCPYCLSPIELGEERIRCPRCGVAHHAGCWRANGKCSVYGCDGWALWNDSITGRLAPDADGSVEISQTTSEGTPPGEQDRCMECGKPVKSGILVCLKCRTQHRGHFFENCSGPSALLLLGMCAAAAVLLRTMM